MEQQAAASLAAEYAAFQPPAAPSMPIQLTDVTKVEGEAQALAVADGVCWKEKRNVVSERDFLGGVRGAVALGEDCTCEEVEYEVEASEGVVGAEDVFNKETELLTEEPPEGVTRAVEVGIVVGPGIGVVLVLETSWSVTSHLAIS